MTAYLVTPDNLIAVYGSAKECEARAGRIVTKPRDLLSLSMERLDKITTKLRDGGLMDWRREGGGFFLEHSERYNELAERRPSDLPETKQGLAGWAWRLMSEGVKA